MLGVSQRLSLQLRQSPQQVLLSSLLQLPMLSLEQRIKLELETNPLLELDLEEELDQEQEEETEQQLEQKKEEDEESESIDDKEDQEVDWETVLNDEDQYEIRAPRDKNVEEYERPEVHQETLTDHLISQLNMTQLSPDEIFIGEYIIWNINNVGYLATDVHIIAENLETNVDVVEKVLSVIQTFDPPGIGARNLQECLLIQLLDQEELDELAIEIIRDYFDDFKNKRYERIVKKLEVTLEDIREIIEVITKLNPKPGEGHIIENENYVIPDVTVEKSDGKFNIILNDWNIPQLRINETYRRIILDKKNTTKDARNYIKQRLESARWLINSIHQRRATIIRVMESLIEKQRDFFEYGKDFLKPMILKDIADDIGMDISTISRVTNGKYVQTEYGVFELKYFFSERIQTDSGEDVSNKKIKTRIKEIISKEDPKKPLNDLRIAELLKKEGYNVARRTVAKYREQMSIPVSRLRRGI